MKKRKLKRTKLNRSKAPAKAGAQVLLEHSPAMVDALRASSAVETVRGAVAHTIPKGLMEVEVKGTHFRLLGMRDQSAVPTLEQRVAIASRLNDVGPRLPRYVKLVMLKQPEVTTTSIGDAKMGKKAVPGLEMKDLEKAFEEDKKNAAEREKELKKEAAVKAKADEEQRKKDSAARKKMKGDVTPKPDPKKPAKVEKAAKDADPKVKVKGVSTPPVKKSAGMSPTKVPAGGFNKDNKPGTSGELIRARIGEHKLTDDQIAAEVRKLWPGRTTAVSDVRWNRAQMLKAGVKSVPDPVEGSTVPGRK